MKTFFSLVFLTVFFITQTLSVAQTAQKVTLFSSNDFRLKLAEEINVQGEHLQKIADTQGMESAHQEFEALAKKHLKIFLDQMHATIQNMSENDAQIYVDQIQKNYKNIEVVLSIISDRGKTAKEKLNEFSNIQNESNFTNSIEKTKSDANIVGYQKVFSSVANQMRDRSWNWDSSLGTVVIVILFIGAMILFVAATYALPVAIAPFIVLGLLALTLGWGTAPH